MYINGYAHISLCIFFNYLIFLCGTQRSVVHAQNSSDSLDQFAKVIADRQSILMKIARSDVDGLSRKPCNTSSFVVMSEVQFGERMYLLYQVLQYPPLV